MKHRAIRLSLILLFLLPASRLFATDVRYPTPCYEGAELEKVRQWEKSWVGKKITSADVDRVKEFMPESLYSLMKDTQRWGESWFTVVPYQEILPSPGMIKYAKKYYGQPKVGSSGEMLNYISGVPFPDTKDPNEMAHNFRNRTTGDGTITDEKGYIIDGRLKYDMDYGMKNKWNFFSSRTDTPPVPEYEKNPKQIWRAFQARQLAPPEARNLRIMEINYKDRMKTFDSWMWLPAIRRVKRRSATERQDAQGGGDFSGFDNFGWDGAVQLNKYRYLGQKDLLMARHDDATKLEHKPGHCFYSGIRRERIKMHLVEATSKDPNFMYTKMIWYLDPETWQMLYSDRYDRRGNLWKIMDQVGCVGQGYNGVPVSAFSATQMIDVQRRHSSVAAAGFQYGVELDARIFTLQWMQKRGY
jgi:hypothetical protein